MSKLPLLPLNAAATVAAALLPVALGAALAEALALRLVLRMGQALPALPGLSEVFGVIASAGVLAQNLATLAGTLTLAALALDRLMRGNVGRRMAGALLLAAALAAALLAAGSGGHNAWPVAYIVSLAAMAAAVATAAGLPLRGGRAWLALPLAAYTALVYHFSAPVAGGAGIALPLAAEAYFAAEALAVAAALALPLAVRARPGWRWLVAATALPVVILLALLARPWTVASLSVWTVGFTLFLPAPVYPLALGAFIATMIALVRAGQAERRMAVGLAFLALGGLKLDYSYFHLLALLAITCLSAPGDVTLEAVAQPTPQGDAAAPLSLQKAG